MKEVHTVRMSPVKYPHGLRIFECQECDYALAAEVDEHGSLRIATRIKFNAGNAHAAHRYLHQDPRQ